VPYRQTGNKECSNLRGFHQILLTSYTFAFPEATADEIAAFIANNSDGIVYSRPAISTRLRELNITRKRGSTEASQASLPHNVLIRELFWTTPWPTGINGIPMSALLDMDECGMSVDKVNRRSGYAYSGVRVRKPGNYSRDSNLTIMYCIEPGNPHVPPEVQGSIARPRRWCRVTTAGTNVDTFNRFVSDIVESIDNNILPVVGVQNRTFMWDNLRAHKSPILYETVQGGGRHHILPSPPYMPEDGPIEFAFCQLENQLNLNIAHISTIDGLATSIRNILANLGNDGGFHSTFIHCGYRP